MCHSLRRIMEQQLEQVIYLWGLLGGQEAEVNTQCHLQRLKQI